MSKNERVGGGKYSFSGTCLLIFFFLLHKKCSRISPAGNQFFCPLKIFGQVKRTIGIGRQVEVTEECERERKDPIQARKKYSPPHECARTSTGISAAWVRGLQGGREGKNGGVFLDPELRSINRVGKTNIP